MIKKCPEMLLINPS